jgi:membrane protease YdiL (CAAX protease family)
MEDERKLTFGDYFERLMIFVGLIVLVGSVQLPVMFIARGKLSSVGNYAVAAVYLLGFLVAIWLAQLAYRKYGRRQMKKVTWPDIKMIVIAWVGFILLEFVLGNLNKLLYHVTQTDNNQAIQTILTSNHLTLVLMAFTAIFCSPILEETIFRGYLITAFFKSSSKWLPIVISGLAFAFPHMDPNPARFNIISFLTYAILGGVLAYLYVSTKNLKVSIGLHFLNNLVAVGAMVLSVFYM